MIGKGLIESIIHKTHAQIFVLLGRITILAGFAATHSGVPLTLPVTREVCLCSASPPPADPESPPPWQPELTAPPRNKL